MNKNSLQVQQFSSVCRTCLNFLELPDKAFTVCKHDLEGKVLKELLEICLKIEVKETDNLPKNMCDNCVSNLSRTYNFRKQCQESDKVLRNILEIKLNVESFIDCNNLDQNLRTCEDKAETISVDSTEIVARPKVIKQSFACSHCLKVFNSQGKLSRHSYVHNIEKQFECTTCLAGFNCRYTLKRHEMIHNNLKPHVCDKCGKGFRQLVNLKIHSITHLNDKPFTCSYCGLSFKYLQKQKLHVHTKHLVKDVPDHKEKYEISPIKCEQCNRRFPSKSALKSHQIYHSEKNYLCTACGKAFYTMTSMQIHHRTHSGEKPYQCDNCPKAFAQFGALRVHKFIHTGERPYKCDVCEKGFTQYPHLKQHMLTHSGEKPHNCSYCGKGFSLKNNLVVHVRTHTGETPYKCLVCKKGFYDSSSMKKHQKRSHNNVEVADCNDSSGTGNVDV